MKSGKADYKENYNNFIAILLFFTSCKISIPMRSLFSAVAQLRLP